MQACVKCHRPAQAGEPACLCAGCGALQPAHAGQTHFDLLGVERGFAFDARELERKFKALSRKLHPDRFVSAAPADRMLSLRRATDLNQAYKTLKDPVRRAEYLLLLEGIDVGKEDGGGVAVAPEFLMEILELREGLLEAKLEGDEERLAVLTADVRGRAADAMTEVAQAFAEFRAGQGRAALERVAQSLVALRYFRRFLDEVEAGDEAKAELPNQKVEPSSHVEVDDDGDDDGEGDKVPDGFR